MLSKSESGKLGAIKTKIWWEKKKLENINNYNKNPNSCIFCHAIFEYNNRKRSFCNHSCSAAYNNKGKIRSKLIRYCSVCSNRINSNNKKCCSAKCRSIYKYTSITKPKIQAGLIKERSTLKKFLILEKKYECFICGLNEWNGKKLSLELDHINGDPSNNFPDNLQLLCPNCHSTTTTWKGRNKGKGRKSLGLAIN